MALEVTFEPTKKLFLDVLTKDISVRDCLLDLIDNSVDAYIRNKLKGKRKIELTFGHGEFKIFDNCGGIKKSDVENEIFKFGVSKEKTNSATIGFYGIGLKRSIFKLGEDITFETDDGKDYCYLPINVQNWSVLPGWTLNGDTKKSKLSNKQKAYTRIHITKVRSDINQYLDTIFINEFKERVSIYYSQFMQKRIDIYIDGKKIIPINLKIKLQEGANPANYETEIDSVKIRIIAWIEPREKKREDVKTGWNVFMNERIVLYNDTSEQTGWTGADGELPGKHPRYNEFRGLVFISTNTPNKLPINTTKTGFNQENPIYKYVLVKMIEIAKPIIKVLNEKYKKISETEIQEINKVEETPLLMKEIKLNEIVKKQAYSVPKRLLSLPKFSKITYEKKKERVETAKKYLNVKSNSDVGSETFEYFWKSEGLDNE